MSKTPRHPPVSHQRKTEVAGRASGRRVRLLVALLAAWAWGGGLACASAAELDPNELPFEPPVHLDDSSMPDPAITPGDFMLKAKSKDLCDEDNADRQRVPTSAMCDRVFDAYEIPPERRFQYRCRYLVPLTVGGANTQQNVWPQPAREALFKEKLDAELQKQVCGERVSPAQAQVDVAGDWVRAYRRYLMPSDPPPFVAESQPASDKTPVAVQSGAPASTVAGGGPVSMDPGNSGMAPQIAPGEGPRGNRRAVQAGQASTATGPGGPTPNASSPAGQALGGAMRQRPATAGVQRSRATMPQRRATPVSARSVSARPRDTRQ